MIGFLWKNWPKRPTDTNTCGSPNEMSSFPLVNKTCPHTASLGLLYLTLKYKKLAKDHHICEEIFNMKNKQKRMNTEKIMQGAGKKSSY